MEDISKIAFITRQGHYKYMVMSFRVTNAPTLFMNLMSHILIQYLDKFIVVFINDMLIYTRNREEHVDFDDRFCYIRL